MSLQEEFLSDIQQSTVLDFNAFVMGIMCISPDEVVEMQPRVMEALRDVSIREAAVFLLALETRFIINLSEGARKDRSNARYTH